MKSKRHERSTSDGLLLAKNCSVQVKYIYIYLGGTFHGLCQKNRFNIHWDCCNCSSLLVTVYNLPKSNRSCKMSFLTRLGNIFLWKCCLVKCCFILKLTSAAKQEACLEMLLLLASSQLVGLRGFGRMAHCKDILCFCRQLEFCFVNYPR